MTQLQSTKKIFNLQMTDNLSLKQREQLKGYRRSTKEERCEQCDCDPCECEDWILRSDKQKEINITLTEI